MIVFGPIPSRRLGRILVINNISPKYCTYSCVYCQKGFVNHMTKTIRNFYSSGIILKKADVNTGSHFFFRNQNN